MSIRLGNPPASPPYFLNRPAATWKSALRRTRRRPPSPAPGSARPRG